MTMTAASKTIVALYDNFPEARQAIQDLEGAGIPHDDISLVAKDGGAEQDPSGATTAAADKTETTHASTGAGTGATIGTVLGGGAGLLAGLGLLAIPGIGPVVAAGPLIAALSGAGVGAAAGGLLGSLTGLGVPAEDAHTYAEGVRRGGALLTVRADESTMDHVTRILERHAPVDVEERAGAYRQEGWSGFDERAEPYAAAPTNRAAAAMPRSTAGSTDEVIPVAEEELQVGKRAVDKGTVRIRSYITETPVQEQVTLHEERVGVERRPAVDRGALGADAFRTREINATEMHEEAVVSKQARVAEEVVVHKDVTAHDETVRDSVRHTEVDVDRSATDSSAPSARAPHGAKDGDLDIRTEKNTAL
jgi:uncharacterized protein (TIGR02271 family)